MDARELKRNYDMSDGELVIFAGILETNMSRDSTEFALWGVDAADITALNAKVDEFEAIESDDELRGQVSLAVDNKDAARDALESAIRLISNRFELKWGADSPQYDELGVKGLTKLSEGDLNLTAMKVSRVAENYLTDLADEGLTQAMIDDVVAKKEDFSDKIIIVGTKRTLRDNKTAERIKVGNELYALVVKYCKIGKSIWREVSESKYNDYILYHEPTDLPSKVQNLQYDAVNTKLKWDLTAGADTYQLEQKMNAPEFDWETIYEDAANEFVHTPPAPGEWLYRCRGKNANGDGSWSDELTVMQV